MQYNAPPGSQDPNAPYVNGIPGQIKGSPANAHALEYPQREILNVITAVGLTPTNNELDQLLRAIRAIIEKAAMKYELCEFYSFRHPTLKPGFQPAQGGLLSNAATLYPDAWAYLQTAEGQRLCKTEAAWQAMTTATWATLADGTTVGWNGIGGAPFYAPNTATGALRLPDLRGMYAEAAGFDSLGVGGVHGDGMRRLWGGFAITTGSGGNFAADAISGVFYPQEVSNNHIRVANAGYVTGSTPGFASERLVPVSAKNQPRAWGSLACVYLGLPVS